MLKIKLIRDKFPIGSKIRDCFGVEGVTIFNHNIAISQHHKGVVYVLGHQCVYDETNDVWAEVIN